MNEEIMKVLEMVKSGKITTEEGENLISAITGSVSAGIAPKRNAGKYSMLRVRVDSHGTTKKDGAKVNVNVPLSIAKKALGLVSLVPNDVKSELADQGIDLDSINLGELIEMFENGEITEDLVDIVAGDDEQGATVKVYVD